jgi:subtilisin family serine protease
MKSTRIALCFLGFFLAVLPLVSAQGPNSSAPGGQVLANRVGPPGSSSGADRVANEILVKYKPGAAALTVQSLEAKTNLRAMRLYPEIGAFRYEVPAKDFAKVLAELKKSDSVEYAEPNYVVHILQGGSTKLPNDPDFKKLWGLDNQGGCGKKKDADIDAPEGWVVATDAPDVLVAVIDTGIDFKHSDLKENIYRNPAEIPGNGVDDDGNGYIDDASGWDFFNGDSDPTDDHRHGTHVSGTIGAVGNNGIGVTGVCWKVKILPLKFLDRFGTGSISGAVEAVFYAVKMKARILHNSWGGPEYSKTLEDALRFAEQAGCLIVAAAGNDGKDADKFPI